MNKCIVRTLLAAGIPLISMAQPLSTSFQTVFTGSEVKVFTGQLSSKPVVGRPFSATEERRSLQTLADGTRIETTSTDKYYRDAEGRTRIERENGSVSIHDPVTGAGMEINGKKKMVTRSDAKSSSDTVIVTSNASLTPRKVVPGVLIPDASESSDLMKAKLDAEATVRALTATASQIQEQKNAESLGFQVMNGVSAEGTRNTTTIPLGKIGNDRPISVVTERWYSSDLKMLIKSVNSDPRFGETTYELKNIVEGSPDPSLFAIPPSTQQ